ncbi:MAG TPA: hypothetical protein VG963_23780, partial [Polyangiaceae bacterium]|nr:hypothetical protein [Polyangiaceae bacterium]
MFLDATLWMSNHCEYRDGRILAAAACSLEREGVVITEKELASIERKLNAWVRDANDSGGQSLAENAIWTASALA